MVIDTAAYNDVAVAATELNLAPVQFAVGTGYQCGTPIEFEVTIQWESPPRMRVETVTITDGWVAGPSLFSDDAEGGPTVWALTSPAQPSTADNHTTAGSRPCHSGAVCGRAGQAFLGFWSSGGENSAGRSDGEFT